MTEPTYARGLGYVRDTFDARDIPVDTLLVRAQRSPGLLTPNARHLRTVRLLQGGAGACFAFALARAIHMTLQLQMGDAAPLPPLPSPSFIYWNARAQALAGVPRVLLPQVLDDVGSRPRLGMRAVQALGFAPWDAAPYDPRTVRARPPREAYMRAHDQRGFVYYRIDGGAAERVDRCARAMEAGAAVIVCMELDEAFLRNRGEVVTRINPRELVGGHAMTLLDMTRGTADVDNWWDNWGAPTDDWNAGGIGSLHLDVLGGPFVHDIYAVRAAPLYAEDLKE